MSAPILLSDTDIAWVSGSTASDQPLLDRTGRSGQRQRHVVRSFERAELRVPRGSRRLERPDGGRRPVDPRDRLHAIKVSTDGERNGRKSAELWIEWDRNGERHSLQAGKLRFSNKKYKGEDFAILTEKVTAVIRHRGRRRSQLGGTRLPGALAVEQQPPDDRRVRPARLPPAGDFTSLHHDERLQGARTTWPGSGSIPN